MAVVGQRVDVTNEATVIVAAEQRIAGTSAVLRNRGDEAVFVGGENVATDTDSYQLDPGEPVSIDLDSGDELFGICVAGPVRVDVLKKV